MTRTSPIIRALDIQAHTIEALMDILTATDLVLIEAAMGRTSDKRAIVDLIDLFNSPEFHGLENKLRACVTASTIARGFEPLVTPAKKPKSEAKPRRKAVPKDPQ